MNSFRIDILTAVTVKVAFFWVKVKLLFEMLTYLFFFFYFLFIFRSLLPPTISFNHSRRLAVKTLLQSVITNKSQHLTLYKATNQVKNFFQKRHVSWKLIFPYKNKNNSIEKKKKQRGRLKYKTKQNTIQKAKKKNWIAKWPRVMCFGKKVEKS